MRNERLRWIKTVNQISCYSLSLLRKLCVVVSVLRLPDLQRIQQLAGRSHNHHRVHHSPAHQPPPVPSHHHLWPGTGQRQDQVLKGTSFRYKPSQGHKTLFLFEFERFFSVVFPGYKQYYKKYHTI